MRLAEQFDFSQNDPVIWDDYDTPIWQNHWRRFAISIVASVLACAMMLGGFAEILISQRPLPPPRTTAVEAFLVEPSPPAEPAKPIPLTPILHPAHRKTLAAVKPRNLAAPAPAPALNPQPEALPASTVGGISLGRATVPSESDAGATGAGGGVPGGGAAESIGARALYAPTPQIPDDLRENIFSALAIAHFVVDRDGKVQVTLVQATSNPRLNQVILASLQTWKFFPATRDGVPVASEFDLRIPIAVQ
jgi:protein TonB